jgi:peptidoglycan/xylan/chitin deacetylase (PgdA/CDA1 family)
VAPVLRPLPAAIALRDLPPAPIYHGPRSRRAVSLLINVAWGEQYVDSLLTTLAHANAAATFCLVGRWAEEHPALVGEMAALARQRGLVSFCNHGARDHGWALLGQGQALASIRGADATIDRLTGSVPAYFAPHRGEYNPAVLAAARQSGHELVLWSLDTIDWRPGSTAAGIEARIAARLQPGDIILLHPTAATAQALSAVIAEVRARGLDLVTLDQLLSPTRGPWDP